MSKSTKNSYIYFWGVSNTNGWLSNFYTAPFICPNGVEYFCTEQYFMEKKRETFDPENVYLSDKIMNERNPVQIKKYGRSVSNYNEEIWNNLRYKYMLEANKLKFSQNKVLLAKLKATGDSILVEASPYDRVWGCGLLETHAKKTDETLWPGQNLLGKVLMQVRTEL